jgi:citrate lyase subunit beta/citryl-CoA lyase
VTSPINQARSLLFVPGDRPERFAKAHAAGGDAVVLDLEDGIDPERRDASRRHVSEYLHSSAPKSLVRLSGAKGSDLGADLAFIADRPALAGVLIPKAEDSHDVEAVIRGLPPGKSVVLLLETAVGVLAAPALARVTGVTRLALGTFDLEVDTGLSQDADILRSVRVGLTLASSAAGLWGPIDGVCADLADPSVTAAAAREAARAGFTGKLCVHPKQVAAVNGVYSPSPESVKEAQRILAASARHGAAAFRLDGRMVDAPVIRRAQSVITAATAFSIETDPSTGH